MTADTTKATDEKPSTDADSEESPYAKFITFVGDKTVITFRRKKFSFPTSRADWPTIAFQMFQRQRHADGIELVLGPRQWAVLNQVAPKISDFWEFVPIFAHAAGFVSLESA